jgi:hypothetical protein
MVLHTVHKTWRDKTEFPIHLNLLMHRHDDVVAKRSWASPNAFRLQLIILAYVFNVI